MSVMPAATAPLDDQLPALRQRLLRHARMVMHDIGTAEDLVQDTLLAVFETEAQRRGDASLTTWATAILKNKIADWYRAPARRRMVQLPDDDAQLGDGIDALYDAEGAYTDPVPPWQQPENQAEARQMMGVLNGCMTALPSQTGRVFMMREWLGFETAEIADRLGLSADNCRQLLHRARMGLRGCMQQRWIEARAPARALQ
ncbi:MAG: sigma-70 family RNA polymerase sigma factor [Burkholderiaceae bacterium]|nr:sigma-70 family RNA polymerase sigma factor [Burkholderiaceae bacterium]